MLSSQDNLTVINLPNRTWTAQDIVLLGDTIYLTYDATDGRDYPVRVHVATRLETLSPCSVSIYWDNQLTARWERKSDEPAPEWVMVAWRPVETALRDLAAPDSDDVDPKMPRVALAIRLYEIFRPAQPQPTRQPAITAA